ncbi:04701dda-5036-4cd2-ae65-4a42fd42bf6f [Sclerotinia trifoliorum]|uniref:04701dda-5036-4cd2-ae65-4a42fd42bf6f n=1 Tax=Sclerotinia trifoliorum TaxID=28548 RepID=A0A8H2VT22_9HELO|nr:04701dda-5036-4cd2-ae65-4a42fd42bf6f [Sclerotinia trifoliorum]
MPIDNDHCYSPRSPRSLSLMEPAPAAEHQEWAFKGFLERTRIGNDTTYNLEFQLQHVPEHLHLPVLSEAMNIGFHKRTFTDVSTPCNVLHSKVHSARLSAKRKRVPWELTEYETILRMKKDDCF